MKTSTALTLLLVALCGCSTVHASLLRGTAGAQRHKALAYRTLQKALAEGKILDAEARDLLLQHATPPPQTATAARKLMGQLVDWTVGRQYANDMSHISCTASKEKYETCYPADAACTCVMWHKGPVTRTKPCPCTKENERTRKYKAWKDTDAGKEEAKKAAEDRVMSTKSWSEAQKKKWNAYAKEVEAHCPRGVEC